MGQILLELPNETVRFEFAGDQPTAKEKFEIGKVIREKQRGLSSSKTAKQSEDEQLFDTTSGIQDAGLRAKLSAAETPAEEELQLRELYGLTEQDYDRDSRGRLAITPSGGKKLGLDLSKATLIDEGGFSRYDLADLAGIVPEVVGGVAGAAKGFAAGAPFGPLGMLLGSAVGAGTGAAVGQAVEEGVEAIGGVQDQTAEEVVGDLGKEFAIGFLSDVTLGTFGFGIRAGRNYLRPGKGKTDEEILEIGDALIEGGAKVDPVTGELKELGMAPSLSAIGANQLISRQQAIGEKVFGSSPRLKKNFEVLQQKLINFRSKFSGADDDEIGQMLLSATGAQAKRLDELQRQAQQSVLQTARALGDDLGAAASKNVDIDTETFEILINAQKAFDSEVSIAFKSIDDALESAGSGIDIIPIGNIKAKAAAIADDEVAGLAGREYPILKEALDAVNAVKGDKISYVQAYKLRKTLNDKLSKATSKTERDAINDLLRKTDVKLNTNFVKESIEASDELTDLDKRVLLRASDSLDNARKVYNEGATIFEDIESSGIIKSIGAKARAGQSPGVDDIRLDKIIKNDKPLVLERMLKAVEYGASKDAKIQSSEAFRQKVASEWLNDALTNSGLKAGDNIDPTKFKGAAFAKSVRDLGRTADVLFGPDAAKIRKLADTIEKTSVSNLDSSVIKKLSEDLGEGAPLVDKLTALAETQSAIHTQNLSQALLKLQRGGASGLRPQEAADVIADAATKPKDIKQIMNVFEGNEEAISKIRGNYMERLISNFGDSVTTDGKSLAAFAKRIIDADEGGKLKAIFGDADGEDLVKFAKMLKVNSQTATGGDLIAANIAAGPMQNLEKIVRLSIMGRIFSSKFYYKSIMEDYQKLKTGLNQDQRASMLGKLMVNAMRSITQGTGQSVQEGKREVENQVRAVADSSGLSQQLSNLSQQIQQPTPNNSPAMPQQATPAAPGPNNLRQQAAQNPGIAQALGIRGPTAGLLQP